jgi:hypothetical protein
MTAFGPTGTFSNVRSPVASGGNADLVSEIDRDQYWPSEKQRDAM